MKSLKIAELKNRLSECLRAVEKGGEVLVTNRDRPIARIVPVDAPVRRARVLPPRRAFSDLGSKRYPRANWSITSTELLLEERQQR